MNKTKIRNFALIFTLLLFVLSLAFSVFTLFKANAEEPAEDVNLNIDTCQDLVKTTNNSIYGKENVTAVGWNGWGGFHKYLTFSPESYDVSAIANSGKGALSFWIYVPDEAALKIYTSRTASQKFAFQVSSHNSYADGADATAADAAKWSFELTNEQFKDMRVGWQRAIIPFSVATDKTSIDWTSVKTIRVNAEGMSLSGGYYGRLADFSFTTTNLTKAAITGDPVTTFAYSNVSNTMPDKQFEIDGETGTAYGRPGEGGFVSYHTLDKTYSVQKTDTAAFSVWVKLEKESDKKALNAYNIDVTSTYTGASSWGDDHKYTFDLRKEAFAMCTVGEWSHVIIPLEKANEKKAIDWNALTCIRLNVDGGNQFFGLIAKMEIIQTNYTETTVVGYVPPTVDPEEPEPDRTETLTADGKIVNVSSTDNMATDKTAASLAAIKQLDANTTAQYVIGNMDANTSGGWSTWGGIVRQLVFDKPYNVSAISTNAKGAFVFWAYIHNETTLNDLKEGKGGFGINMSSGRSINENKKWEFNVSSLANDLMIGWNKIIIPFSSSILGKPGGGPETANTVENLRFVILTGVGAGHGDMAFADFGFFLTDKTEPCVINQKTQMTKPDDVAFGVGNASDLTADTSLLDGATAYSAIGKNWGAKTQLITFDKAYDLSAHDTYGKSVLSFGIYFADEATLEAHRAIASGYYVTLGSGSGFNTENGYLFDIAGLFADCSVGWNTVYLPVGTADNKGAIDWASVKFLQISWDKAFKEGECEVAFAQFKLISTDETVRSVENDTGITLGVRSVEEFDKVTLVRSKKNITAYSIIGKQWGRFAQKQVTLAKTYNASKFSENGALAFWLYIENENTLNAYQGVTGGWTVTAYSGSYKSANKLTFEIHSLFADCIVGWNYLVLPVAAGTDTNFDFGALHSIGVECEGKDVAASVTEGKNNIALAEFAIIATQLNEMTVAETISNIEEGLNPIEEKVIIDCNVANGLQFAGNKVDTQDHRYESGCVYTSGAGYGLSAQFDCGNTDLRKPTIVLAFWLWIEDPAFYFESDGTTLKSGINGQVELSSSSKFDTNEINWELNQWGVDKFEKGWNWVVLKGADGNISGGDPNFDALIRFRLYVNGIQQSTMKIDRITIGSGEKLLTAPDWESEKFGSDPGTGFKGPNAYEASNGTYIEVDFDGGAKDFTTMVTETVKEIVTVTKEGCSSSLSVIPVAFVLITGATAVCFLVVRKRKNGGK